MTAFTSHIDREQAVYVLAGIGEIYRAQTRDGESRRFTNDA